MNTFSCLQCGKCFQTKSILNRHLISHSTVKPYQCKICDKGFTQNSSLLRHQAVIHTKEKKFQCSFCNLKFSQKYNVEIHIKRLHSTKNIDANKYPCSHCSCVFNKLNSLNRHIVQTHSNIHKSNDSNDNSFGILIEQLKILQQNSNNIEMNDIDLETVPEKLFTDSKDCYNDDDADRIDALNSQSNINEIISLDTTIDNNKPSEKKRMVQHFPCSECGKKFQRKFDLLRHSRIHFNIKPFSCTKCDKSFTLKCTLNKHLRTHIDVDKKFQCEICFKRFTTQLKFKRHIDIHFLPKSFQCVLCPKSFKLKQSLNAHEKIHQLRDCRENEIRKMLIPPIRITDKPFLENTNFKYVCSKCSLKFKSLTHLRYHETKHIGIKNFKCNTCNRSFLTKASLTCHTLVHNTIRAFKCQICSAKFKSSDSLKRHLSVHNNDRKFMCAYCCKTFNRKSNCQLHLNTHIKDILFDLEPKANNCDNNEKPVTSVNTTISLTTPIIDNTEINFTPILSTIDTCEILMHTCNICKKKFKKPNDLERHARIHNKEKPFTCDKCNKSFTLKGTLKSHMRIHDENKIKICCTVCGKGYSTQSALKLHLRLHTGELPFECDYCTKLFRTAGHKTVHMKQHNIKNKGLIKKKS